MKAVNKDMQVALVATSYSHHFTDSVDFSLDSLLSKLSALGEFIQSDLRSSLEFQAHDSVALGWRAKGFLTQSQTAQSDALGAVIAIDVNLILAPRDRFITQLRLYVAPWNHAILHNGGLMADQLLPALSEVCVAAWEDPLHESICQLMSRIWCGALSPPNKALHGLGGSRRNSNRGYSFNSSVPWGTFGSGDLNPSQCSGESFVILACTLGACLSFLPSFPATPLTSSSRGNSLFDFKEMADWLKEWPTDSKNGRLTHDYGAGSRAGQLRQMLILVGQSAEREGNKGGFLTALHLSGEMACSMDRVS